MRKIEINKNKPLVSIVMPIYNVGIYLKKCLNSCLKQTLKNIEIICVDDGSTDDSYDIVLKYAKKDDRIVPITKKKCRLWELHERRHGSCSWRIHRHSRIG